MEKELENLLRKLDLATTKYNKNVISTNDLLNQKLHAEERVQVFMNSGDFETARLLEKSLKLIGLNIKTFQNENGRIRENIKTIRIKISSIESVLNYGKLKSFIIKEHGVDTLNDLLKTHQQ